MPGRLSVDGWKPPTLGLLNERQTVFIVQMVHQEPFVCSRTRMRTFSPQTFLLVRCVSRESDSGVRARTAPSSSDGYENS